MNADELNKFITSYYDRVAIRDACYYQGHPSTDKNFDEFNKEKSRCELSIFICDAMLLKDLEYNGDVLPCRSPQFNGNCIQFYLLSQIQLYSYIVFRTVLKENKVPSNRSNGFLILFLMEIINNIYGSSFTYKFNELKRIYSIFPKSELYEDLFKEAFEIIYIQNADSQKIEDYSKTTPISVFEDTSLMPFYEEKKQKSLINTMMKSVNSHSRYRINDVELFIFNDCFRFICDKLTKNISLGFHRYNTIENLIYLHNKGHFNYPLRHLMAQYPLTTNINYENINGEKEYFKYGMHTKTSTHYTSNNTEKICYATLDIFNSIAHYCEYDVSPEVSVKLASRYQLNDDNFYYGRVNQTVLNIYMEKWVWDNQYAKIGYRLSLSKLKDLKLNGVKEKDILAFRQWKETKEQEYYDNKAKQFIIKRNQEVRDRIEKAERLHGISAYVSLEEKKAQFDEMISSNVKANEIFYAKEKEKVNIIIKTKDDTTSRFVANLSTLERKVLLMLCYDNFDCADDAAWDNDDLISNVIDRINVKSNKYLECDVIEDTEVVEKFIKEILSKIE